MSIAARRRRQCRARLRVGHVDLSTRDYSALWIDNDAADLSWPKRAEIAFSPILRNRVTGIHTVRQEVIRGRSRKQLSRDRIAAELLHLETFGQGHFPRQQIYRDVQLRQAHVVRSVLRKARTFIQ